MRRLPRARQARPSAEPWASWPTWTPLAIAAAVPCALFFLLPPLSKVPMWDPYELGVADLSRRIAVHLYRAGGLVLDGADNTLPHLDDLGRPQLPFSSIALGFKIFGLAGWAGRLPLALWGLLGVLATYAFVSRLFDRRTGAVAAVALSTMPLYCLEARTMLGDVCTMAALAMSFGGLAVAVFDRGPDGAPPRPARRAPWLLLGAVGLFAGFESRGALLGIGVPLLGVGLTWALVRLGAARSAANRVGDVIGAVSLAAGVIVAMETVRAVRLGNNGRHLDFWVGAVVQPPSKYPTFDVYIGAIGHALAPWSAFLPFAFGRLLAAPAGVERAAAERESLGRVALLVASAVVLVTHAFLAAYTDLIAFSGPALLAACCAVAIRDFERGARASIFVGLGTLLIAAVLHHDFHELPDKAYEAYGLSGVRFPEAFKSTALDLWWIVLGGFAVGTFLTWVEGAVDREPFEPSRYAEVVRELRSAYGGVLESCYLACSAGLSLAAGIVWLGTALRVHRFEHITAGSRDVLLNAWWVVAFVPPALVFGLLFACDAWLWAFQKARPPAWDSPARGLEPFTTLAGHVVGALREPREAAGPAADIESREAAGRLAGRVDWWIATIVLSVLMVGAIPAAVFAVASAAGIRARVAAALAVPSTIVVFSVLAVLGDVFRHRALAQILFGAAAGFVVCFDFYPALADLAAPKDLFESYRHECAGAPLGLLGVGGRGAAYYAPRRPHVVDDPAAAMAWLLGGGERRCLLTKADDLPVLNELWREQAPKPASNLPVIDAPPGQTLLVASALEPSEHNVNPLSSVLLGALPRPQRPLDANLDDKLQVIGIDLVDERNRPVAAIRSGRGVRMRAYYRVLERIQEWPSAFVHIDGNGRHYGSDHKPTGGRYPMSLWLPGDLLVDEQEFKLPPSFAPGDYTLYFGLASGDGCRDRLPVKAGARDDCNRVDAGAIRVQ